MTDHFQVKAAQWNVTLVERRETATSVLGFGVRDGRGVVLKLTTGADDELHSGKVLRAFGDSGTVRVLEDEPGAVLLERLEPGAQLVTVVKRVDDDEATRILAGVIERLAHHTPPPECPTVADWGRGFGRYLARGEGQQISHGLAREAQLVYEELVSSQGPTMLLHGDLQHYNVLFDNRRGWVAIDPKGVVGELEYEVGALLRNPFELPDVLSNPFTITRRLETLTTLLHLDHSRALAWSFAQAVLSAIWGVDDGYKIDSNNPALLLAQILKPMLATKSHKRH